MKFSVATVLAAFAFGAAQAQSATAAIGVQRPSETPTTGGITSHGCYSSNSTTWAKLDVENISVGVCTTACQKAKKDVAVLSGEDCFCGDKYPPKNDLVDDSKCNFPCPFYKYEACGGFVSEEEKYYSVYNTGIKLLVSDESPAVSTTSTTAKATTTKAGGAIETIVETPTITPTPTADPNEKKGGTNVAGIAAGVVVGVVVVLAIVGGAFFYVRRKRNQEIEEEHRRNAAVNAFIGGSKPPSSSGVSMSDSRMDPTLAHRRMSDGSIADNQDYSRKILRVTNA
ncbi:Cell wall integrity and stress response component 1 [Colletotrichum sidae]|uniref:Cell wall integrity and stress response component 1 n=3 Tax=Colletotrichum orbiculare species complex TaxID=2707354 RepID=N4VTR3_COLOR|nr:Cell wall integrity and stress response component 1 [Colletotrichum orbiculare MAFF 240422]TDZ39153.1 Cell wall integrity and stress response component 1 [Colletotrichum trifolii]TEA18402.1 Cell wall integrity and stress response component 1 [Colletotrichum sidae]